MNTPGMSDLVARLREYEGDGSENWGPFASLCSTAADFIEKQAVELAEPEALTWFWEIVDREGFRGVPSDERNALARICRLADRLEAAEEENASLAARVVDKLLTLERYIQFTGGWGDEVIVLKQHAAGEYVKWSDILFVVQSLTPGANPK